MRAYCTVYCAVLCADTVRGAHAPFTATTAAQTRQRIISASAIDLTSGHTGLGAGGLVMMLDTPPMIVYRSFSSSLVACSSIMLVRGIFASADVMWQPEQASAVLRQRAAHAGHAGGPSQGSTFGHKMLSRTQLFG